MKYILFLLSIVTIPGCADRRSTGEVTGLRMPPAIEVNTPKMEVDQLETTEGYGEVVFDESVFDEPEIEALEEVISLDSAPNETTTPVKTNDRKLIKTGAIDFEVNDIVATKKSINGLVKDSGGYTSSEQEQHGYGRPQFEQVVRIPSDKLDDFVSKITTLAKRITSKNISTKDVSEEFIDIETRLVTKKDLEKNYREILRRARTVKEMLEVERELEDVRGEIESMQGRLQYLKSQVAFSTLTITYFEVVPVVDETTFVDRVATSLGNGWFNVVEITLEVLAAWPVITIGSMAALVMYVRVRGWIRKRRLATVPITNTNLQ